MPGNTCLIFKKHSYLHCDLNLKRKKMTTKELLTNFNNEADRVIRERKPKRKSLAKDLNLAKIILKKLILEVE